MTSDVPVKAVKISLELVDFIQDLDGADVSKLSQKMGKPTSTIHDHLRTLEQMESLVKESGKYYISTRLL
nr:hypothetical protein [Halocatena marina]